MFLQTTQFEFVKTLEQNWQVIKDECSQLLETDYDPWVQQEMYDAGWSVYVLLALNKTIPGHSERCPRTVEIIQSIPGVALAGFSKMQAGTIIEPHVG